VHFSHFEFIPPNPTSEDSIRLVVHSGSPNLATYISHSFTEYPPTAVVIDQCYRVGNFTLIEYLTDTFDLGYREPGPLVINLTIYNSDSSHVCIPFDTMFIRETFNIMQSVSVNEPEMDIGIRCYPTILTEGSIIIESNNDIHTIELFDSYGGCVYSTRSIYQNVIALQLANLPPQVYFLCIRDTKENVHLERIVCPY
jgi:hypothetical protein